ncbi:hypothetical protein L2U69_14725 [Zavarzinia compransoris]|uniref:DUF4870 family protein n=1 Tax=Zavarzinia marina TaxID=2911065 RepID=UPI001F1820E4|nr:DUF4870 domain-containing protein [Zavarzinia marina]MCF4166904.1 hypothetical protein [Zavarzinia marina]
MLNDPLPNPRTREDELRGFALAAHICMGAGFINGITFVVAVVIAYIKRGEAEGTIYRSHFDAVIKTFWLSLLFGIIGAVATVILIGFVVLAAVAVYVIYRVVIGIVRALDRRPY